MADPLAPFDDDLVAAVAADHDLPESRLREAIRRHHAYVESLSGVDELVYDWRQGLPYDPLVARTEEAYHLSFLPSVWEEFGEQLGFEAATLAAVRDVHDRQARRVAEERGDPTAPYEGAAPMVLSRD